MESIKKFLKGIVDSLKYFNTNPIRFHLASILPMKNASSDYLLVKLKHEAHLLDKNVKNEYKEGHGLKRKEYTESLIKECRARNLNEEGILNWAEAVLEKYDRWKVTKEPVINFGENNRESIHPLSVSSVRFWKDKKPDRSLIVECVESAQLAPASCNRQAFKVLILENESKVPTKLSALNSSMFVAAPYRVFIFYNRNNYTEKYSAAIDVGMFSQNFILEAKNNGLGCCCCYASEQLDKSQEHYRRKFALPKEYYCLLTILVGYPNEVVCKPPRGNLENVIQFYTQK